MPRSHDAMGWELVPFIWLAGMILICVFGSRLRGIEDEETEHLLRKPYPSEFALKMWDAHGPEYRQERVNEWFKEDAEERQQWRAGQPARNREKWKLRIIVLIIGIVFLWSLIANMTGG